MNERCRLQGHLGHLLLGQLVLSLAVFLLRTAPKENAGAQARTGVLTPALDYIRTNYAEDFYIESLAELCHLSPTHFRRLFLACMDQTPLQFVISTRIYQACLLLANTNDPVLSIAQAVGMPSASSFNRNFQQVVGMSPRQYRASLDQNGDGSRRSGEVLAYKGWMLPDK